MSSDVDPDARTETLSPVYIGRSRAVLITDDGTRVLPGIDTDVTPMAFVDQTRTMLAVLPRTGEEEEAAAEAPRPLGVRIAAVSALAVMAVCGMLVVALAMALAAR